ncbi:MAG: type IV secretory system conjugative DNA transfer family protein [Spirochaetaceae bacterium]|nr:type IV secretory system conjugative DNA transfer family protein [Spirochaetaceae bacterium]
MHLLKPSQKIVQSGIYNILRSAPARSGKGVSNVIPTLLSYPGSMIVLDFKGRISIPPSEVAVFTGVCSTLTPHIFCLLLYPGIYREKCQHSL